MKRIIHTPNAPAAVGPYSQAVEANGTLFISMQIAIDPAIGKIVDGGIKEQSQQVMKNILAILREAGYSLDDVVKSTCTLDNMDNFKAMNEVYGEYYSENPPARAAYQVCKLPLGAMVGIETIACK